ncbi:MAG TPA: NAD-dependent epimerase/dehydratase family protein, partial [Gammaproteobacteria bacterium]|nr:NAD-dependent epimerase/dehydratase family protein [Gammaproteobacteria bacterium]
TWEDYRAVNVNGTMNVLAAAKRAGVRRVVHCSTVGVATEATAPPYCERTPYSPQLDDKYEVTKCEAERAALAYAGENAISLSVIRPAQVYGPGDLGKVKFYKLVKKGVIVNPGRTNKHLIFIDDLCRSFMLAMTIPDAEGEVFLIADSKPTPLAHLVRIVADTLGVAEPRIRLPAWPVVSACSVIESISRLFKYKPPVHKRSMDFFTRSIECRTDKARRLLGFESRISVEDGVRMTADWYRAKGMLMVLLACM